MLGWIFDASARAACRSYDAIFGSFPPACQVSGGRPLLVLVAGCLAIALALHLFVRAVRA